MSPVLSGPVSVCIDRPVLSLDRPFTYELPEGLGAGLGSLVSVPFHGRSVRGWVLGPTGDIPPRILQVRKLESPVSFFDESGLSLLRWIGWRYVAPLAAVIRRSLPPRVVSEESIDRPGGALTSGPFGAAPSVLQRHRNSMELFAALAGGAGNFLLRPIPEVEPDAAVEAVARCLDGGRRAIVMVPEVDPLPATAAAVFDTFGHRAVSFLGGGKRVRYRTWLEIRAGQGDVVVGSRAAVFAPVGNLGLILVSRENHNGHREDRAPYYHARDVAIERCRIEGAVALLSDICPSTEAAALGATELSPTGRSWVPVEVAKPASEGRAPRFQSLLRGARRGFVFEPLKGAGLAQVCRSCGDPAACPTCGGVIRSESGSLSCAVCGAPGSCGRCGSTDLGMRRGGVESVEAWVSRLVDVPVRIATAKDPPRSVDEITLGGPEAVKETGPLGLDLVGILDADLSLRRPGLSAAEGTLAVWMQCVAWARPNGRALLLTTRPNDPAVQALVAGNPSRFHRAETRRRAEAGFPVGHPVFRIVGPAVPGGRLAERLSALAPQSLLTTELSEEAICLLTVRPEDLSAFGAAIRMLAAEGIVSRVEAEPHL